MKGWLTRILEALRYNYWFIPRLMAVGGIILAIAMVDVDRKGLFRDFFEQFGLSYIGDVSSSATVLSTLAGAMITVAGTTFSIAIVVFTLASTQYGPRLLRNFMRDTGNQ